MEIAAQYLGVGATLGGPPGCISFIPMLSDRKLTWHDHFTKWYEKLRALKTLQKGWDSYSAEPPNVIAIGNVEGYLEALRLANPEPVRVEASAMGGVGVTHRLEKRKVYVEFYNDGTVHALFSDGTAGMFTVPIEATPESYACLGVKVRGYFDG